ncbi:MAG: carbamoyltransferase HypF [Planctomycetes bacterium]|nr:carbamoyltransferase HypF [Planctomycetota bacterium]
MIKRYNICITGQVQGVGFRPAVYRLATQLNLTGFVYNDTKGVTIELQGEETKIAEFIKRLNGQDAPSLADIASCFAAEISIIEGEKEFAIKQSDACAASLSGGGTPISRVTADIATCADCLRELFDEKDFRYRYPFINCTNCGPRYSIIRTIPYDRPNTTMSAFAMCGKCADQYHDVANRRFHAQPIACPQCGPKIWLADNKGNKIQADSDKTITQTAQLLREGKIVAIKGIGGFHLAADALNDDAVKRLRERKKREYKLFAMMANSIETIKQHAAVSKQAEELLKSPQSPIVLLAKKAGSTIAASVAEGTNTFGFMLCYAPLHHLLFAEGIKVLVMTSGNISDEPLICKNDEAIERLGEIADAFLMHDREIYRQVDDSIVHFIDDKPVLLRRSRSYVPAPITIKQTSQCDIFAAGADLKNTFSFVKTNQLICSEHIGDLEDAAVYHHYIKSIEHLRGLFEVKPKIVACDLHPAYLSSQYARTWHGLGAREDTAKMAVPHIKIIEVQHHWAHIAAVMAEHNLDEPVIGLACDGTGYGTDGAIWGCECLIATLDNFERFGHLSYYPLAGGDAAGKQPIRPTLALLIQAYDKEFDLGKLQWLLGPIEPDKTKQEIICEQIRKKLNTVQTSSLGRIFDAVAAMLGLGNYNHFEAQLPIALEAIAAADCDQRYDFEFAGQSDKQLILDPRIMIRQIVADIKNAKERNIISAMFHNTVAAGLLEMAKAARQAKGLDKAAISGGVFCNRYLAERLILLLKKAGFSVLYNRDFPANDGCVSVGQAAIAVKLAARDK